MLPILLMLAVAAGIAWPFVSKRLALQQAVEAETAAENQVIPPTIRAREELCPSCSRLNPPNRQLCVECGAQMPVNDVKHIFDGANKDDLLREGVQSGLLLLGMIIAMTLASFLPVGGKLVILLLTVAALGYRLMHSIQS